LILKLDKHVLEICAALFGNSVCEIRGYANVKIVGERETNIAIFLKDFLRSITFLESDIGEVLLFGEESNIPYLREVIAKAYNCESKISFTHETISVRGAIIQAAILHEEIKDVLLLDTTPETYGIGLSDGRYLRMISKNTAIPTKKTELIHLDNEKLWTQIGIFSGENMNVSGNRFIGAIRLNELISQTYKGVIDITIDINPLMIIDVVAKNLDTGKRKALRIDSHSAELPQ